MWVQLLRKGHTVWLSKERVFVTVAYPYEPPSPGHICGEIAIRKDGRIHTWFLDLEGRGMDGSQLLEPVEGQLADPSDVLPVPAERYLLRVVDELEHRIRNLENKVSYLLGSTSWHADRWWLDLELAMEKVD